jgi:hypothetical protein
VTRGEAEQLAEQLQAEHPDRATHRFVARQSQDGDWEVVKVDLPEALRRGPFTETIAAPPRPSPADDPRTAHERNVPGAPGGLG